MHSAFVFVEVPMEHVRLLSHISYVACMRDRLLHVILGVAGALLVFVPTMSLFSMRQVQELSIVLALSVLSVTLLVVAAMLGASAIWRDVEKRYTLSVLGLPCSRESYVIGKFVGIAKFLVVSGVLISVASSIVIAISASQYKSDIPLHWENIVLAMGSDILKYLLVAAIALLLSCVSTSLYLPFFVTLIIYFAGSASQEVYDYVSGDYGRTIPPLARLAVRGIYYLLPNFSALDFKVYAVYGLKPDLVGILYTFGYFVLYTSITLGVAVFLFRRREML